MNLYTFLILTAEKQWDELWDKGQFICNCKSIDSKFQLYGLHDFFVEVELCVITDKIIGKTAFKTGKRVDKYAGSIDINAI